MHDKIWSLNFEQKKNHTSLPGLHYKCEWNKFGIYSSLYFIILSLVLNKYIGILKFVHGYDAGWNLKMY